MKNSISISKILNISCSISSNSDSSYDKHSHNNSNKKIIADKLHGKYVTLREVTVDDADFILSLRCDKKKSMYLNETKNNKEAQIAYIKRYFSIPNEWYFISESNSGKKLGTIRIYDIQGDSFCSGSWIMTDDANFQEIFETEYLLRMYGFNVLGFEKNHLDVRKENKKVWKYHEMLGAKRIGETELNYLYEITKENYIKHAESLWKQIQS